MAADARLGPGLRAQAGPRDEVRPAPARGPRRPPQGGVSRPEALTRPTAAAGGSSVPHVSVSTQSGGILSSLGSQIPIHSSSALPPYWIPDSFSAPGAISCASPVRISWDRVQTPWWAQLNQLFLKQKDTENPARSPHQRESEARIIGNQSPDSRAGTVARWEAGVSGVLGWDTIYRGAPVSSLQVSDGSPRASMGQRSRSARDTEGGVG